jgi:hypothetical protein
MERFEAAVDADLATVATGRDGFKAVRGEYGSGKTFFGRWLPERARAAGFATSEVQISETETPLHRWEKVYRRLVERLATTDTPEGALRPTVDTWFYTLEEDVIAEGRFDPADGEALAAATEALMERRLADVARAAPAFSAVLRAYRQALLAADDALAEGLIAWLGGQPNVAASVKRAAGVKGELDPFGAMHFLAGLLAILRDSGRSGLVLVFYMPRVADLPAGWRHFSVAQKIEHLIGFDRCYEILSWPPSELDPRHPSRRRQRNRVSLYAPRGRSAARLASFLGGSEDRAFDRPRSLL